MVAAYFREFWDVRMVDQNLQEPDDADLEWADVVFLSGMHVQRPRIEALAARARQAGKITCLGGPSVSGCPEWYPQIDYLHLGELGDATLQLVEQLDRSLDKPATQVQLRTKERFSLTDFPTPAYDLLPLQHYLLGSVQFSSGCPFRCEFCDIPALYGRTPRYKSPEQVIRELDALVESGCKGSVYFVDDNFIGNKAAAAELLPHLVEWQKTRGYPLEFACEATLNLAREDELLRQMREAYFTTVFMGIETPSEDSLRSLEKRQNLSLPILDAVDRLNEMGMEVVAGIILGLDSDTPDTVDQLLRFINESQIPMLTINLLQALPRTPLWNRLEQEGRLLPDDCGQETNVRYKMPYAEVQGMWRRVVSEVYAPEALYRRFAYQSQNTYRNRITPPNSPARVNRENIVEGLSILARLIWTVGIRGHYRRTFWEMAWPALRRGALDELIHIGLVGHHLIEFTRKALAGQREKAFYAAGAPPVVDRPLSTSRS